MNILHKLRLQPLSGHQVQITWRDVSGSDGAVGLVMPTKRLGTEQRKVELLYCQAASPGSVATDVEVACGVVHAS